eukprot:TRINITY_DN56346_c0_g1_i1.p1 TRINITY_DN56346_c0_g1~~TRINITY_DN56346_c0_g1_i1.p1  ORF type:complete len:432 (+),score=54.60 TRINITY_DN56346_c0_g1_i1:23-1297(+)
MATLRMLQVTDLHLLADVFTAFPPEELGSEVVRKWKTHLEGLQTTKCPVEKKARLNETVPSAPLEGQALVAESKQLTDVCFQKTVALLIDLIEREVPDILVLTGDVFDGRGLQTKSEVQKLVRRFFEEISDKLTHSSAMVDSNGKRQSIPLVFIPGNHEGDFESWKENSAGTTNGGEELLQIINEEVSNLSALKSLMSSDDAVRLTYFDREKCGPFNYVIALPLNSNKNEEPISSTADSQQHPYALVFFFDSGRSAKPYEFNSSPVQAAEEWLNNFKKVNGNSIKVVAKIAFVHEPVWGLHDHMFTQKDRFTTIVGTLADLPEKASYLDSPELSDFLQRHSIHVMCGHYHHNDGVGSSVFGSLVGFGRTGSFFPPSEHECNKLLQFCRGGRMFEVKEDGAVATWVADEHGRSNVAHIEVGPVKD